MLSTPVWTQRLQLRPLDLNDATALFAVYRDPAAMRFMHEPPHVDVGQTRTTLAHMLTADACWWAICLRGDDRARGFVGYLANTNVPGMGYILHPDLWGSGYMTEAVHAALEVGFTSPELDRVELWINDANIASRKVAQRTGFSLRGRFRMRYPHAATAHDKLVFGLYRYEWEAQHLAPTRPIPLYRLQPILSVLDVKESAAFYCDQLEFTLDFLYGNPPVHGAVACNEWTTEGVTIQLSKVNSLPVAIHGMALYIFAGPDLDSRHERYAARGVTVIQPPSTMPWGMREFQIADNTGYRLRFGTPV